MFKKWNDFSSQMFQKQIFDMIMNLDGAIKKVTVDIEIIIFDKYFPPLFHF